MTFCNKNSETVLSVTIMRVPLFWSPTRNWCNKSLAHGHSIICGGRGSDDVVVWGTGNLQLPSSGKPKDGSSSYSDNPTNMIRLAVMPGGLTEPLDFKLFRDSIIPLGGRNPPVDLIISTPTALVPLGLPPKNIDMFAHIPTFVIDEVDMLLDGGYLRPLENVLIGFRRADRLDPDFTRRTQHVFCAATLPDMGLKSADAYLQHKFPYVEHIQMVGMRNATTNDDGGTT
jgi:hypothetical protein